MRVARALAFAVLLAAPTVFAGPRESATLEFGRNVNGVEQGRIELTHSSSRFDVLWPFQEEPEAEAWIGAIVNLYQGRSIQALGGERSYSAQKPAITAGKKWSPRFSLEGALGYFHFKNSTTGDETSSASGHARAVLRETESSWFQFSIEKSYLMEEMILSREVRDPYGAVTIRATGTTELAGAWRLQAMTSSRSISDGNTRAEIDLSGMYGISRYPTWFWLGLGFNRVGFNRSATEYYSPDAILALGPRIDFATQTGEKLTVKLGGSVNYVKQSNLDSAVGSYLRGAVAWGQRDREGVELSLVDSRAGQSSSSWSSQTISLNGHWPF